LSHQTPAFPYCEAHFAVDIAYLPLVALVNNLLTGGFSTFTHDKMWGDLILFLQYSASILSLMGKHIKPERMANS
jgi:hypothetical protein